MTLEELVPDVWARRMILNIRDAWSTFDHCIDEEDETPSTSTFFSGVNSLMTHLAQNPFYREFQTQVDPIIMVALAGWEMSTNIEEEFVRDNFAYNRHLPVAHVSRSGLWQLVYWCCTMTHPGGLDCARAHMRDMWRIVSDDESFEEYEAKLRERGQSNGMVQQTENA